MKLLQQQNLKIQQLKWNLFNKISYREVYFHFKSPLNTFWGFFFTPVPLIELSLSAWLKMDCFPGRVEKVGPRACRDMSESLADPCQAGTYWKHRFRIQGCQRVYSWTGKLLRWQYSSAWPSHSTQSLSKSKALLFCRNWHTDPKIHIEIQETQNNHFEKTKWENHMSQFQTMLQRCNNQVVGYCRRDRYVSQWDRIWVQK